MAERRDPAIKLFGKTIKLPQAEESPVAAVEEGGGNEVKVASNREANSESKDKIEEAPSSVEEENSDEQYTNEEKTDGNALFPEKHSKADEQQNETCNNPQEEPNKKHDKILPCPRCKSMDTKFCYYNNYNANQPRHFCKECQRYWTAGGSMRNVPIGAGRRKNKSSAASHHYRNITVSECVRADHPESIHHLGPPLKPNGTVLSFSSDSPLCESMASVMNQVDKVVTDHSRDGLYRDVHEEQSSGSSMTASSSNEESNRAANSNCHGFPPNAPYFNGTTCPYPWSHSLPFCTTRIPIPLYPMTAYWGMSCPSQWLSISPSSGSSCSGLSSPTLGKHSREGDVLKNRNSCWLSSPKPEKSLWIPKTLRIDDPSKPSKCSIWATMGFKKDKADLINRGGGLFKDFQSNGHTDTHPTEVSPHLHANLSRSIGFQESS